MSKQALSRSFLALCCTASVVLASGCVVKKNSTTPGDVVQLVDPNASLPFDINDPDAKFTAAIVVMARDGSFPAASLTYAGATYNTDSEGKITVPNVKFRDAAGIRVSAAGYLPRSVRLSYQDTGSRVLRVVLEQPAIEKAFSAASPEPVNHGPMLLKFAPNSFRTASGGVYTGEVRVAAQGIDPVASVVKFGVDGATFREDFDQARIPQGFGLATDASNEVRFLLPESLFQVEVTGENGEPLTLSSTEPASYSFQLSSLTTHTVGQILPTYTFDETLQRWVQGGTCVVQAIGNTSNLECAGTTDHFSTWMVSSGANTTSPACTNLKFRVSTNDPRYPAKVTDADGTVVTNPVKVDVIDAQAREDQLSIPTQGSPTYSASRACFFQGQSYANVVVRATMAKLDANNKIAREEIFFTIGKASIATYRDKNLRLTRGNLTAASLTPEGIEAACNSCPVTFIDLDTANQTPAPAPATCDGVTCVAGASCNAVTGVCGCNVATDRLTSDGCVPPTCGAGLVWDPKVPACVDVIDCDDDPPVCGANSTCRDITGSYTCTCDAGFVGDANGRNCVAAATCTPNPCLNGGACSIVSNAIVCDCAGTNYTGTNCQTDVDECAPPISACANGTCSNVAGDFSCTSCNSGFSLAPGGKSCTCTPIQCFRNDACESVANCSSGPAFCESGAIDPEPETDDTTCDGVDQDCSGGADDDYVSTICWNGSSCINGDSQCLSGVEGCSTPLHRVLKCLNTVSLCVTVGTGCSEGTPSCDGSAFEAPNDTLLVPEADETGLCSNGIDDDCDGLTDSADASDCGGGPTCGVPDTSPGNCPSPICDGVNGCPGGGPSCGVPDTSPSNCPSPTCDGVNGCPGGGPTCGVPDTSPGNCPSPTCDGVNGCPGGGGGSCSGSPGDCALPVCAGNSICCGFFPPPDTCQSPLCDGIGGCF